MNAQTSSYVIPVPESPFIPVVIPGLAVELVKNMVNRMGYHLLYQNQESCHLPAPKPSSAIKID
jgi:hypothetical protein